MGTNNPMTLSICNIINVRIIKNWNSILDKIPQAGKEYIWLTLQRI
jgi:hypothetical protein